MTENKVNSKKKSFLHLISICLVAIVIIATSSAFLVKAIFGKKDSGFTVTKNYSCSIDNRNGILISSNKKDESFLLAEELGGSFDVEFRAIAKTAGVSDFTGVTFSLVDLESGFGLDLTFEEYFRKEYPDYETQKSGNTGKMVSVPWYRFVSLITHVDTVAGAKNATHYTSFRLRTDENTDNNSASAYNKGNCTFTGDTPNTIKFGFDIFENEIYYYDNDNEKVIFADLDTQEGLSMLGRTAAIPKFNSYSLSVTFSGIKDVINAPAQIVLYSLNGQSLAGNTFNNETGAIITGTPKINNGIVGKAYKIPTEGLKTVDIIDGVKDGVQGKMCIVCPDDSEIELSKEAVFTPRMAGTHKLVLTGKDSEGLFGRSVSYDFYVYEKEPETELTLEYSLKDTTIGVGGCIFLPKATVYSRLTKLGSEPTLALTIKQADGKLVQTLDCADTNKVTFDTVGEYTVEYLATNAMGTTLSKSCKVTVSANVPVFKISKYIENNQYNGFISIPDVTVNNGKANSVLIYPSGSTTSAKYVKLKEIGEYVVRYTSGEYSYDLPFGVNLSPASLFENVVGTYITNHVSSPDYSSEFGTGVGIEAVSGGATVRFINAINISDNKKDDVLVKFMLTPKFAGVPEFSRLTFILTDSLNPEVTLEIRLNRNALPSAEGSQASVKTNDMDAFGKSSSLRGSFWGVPTMYGKYPTTAMSFHYDTANKIVYGSMSNGAIFSDGTFEIKPFYREIINLTDESQVGLGNAFGGFPSGRVYLSIKFEGLEGSSANILMLEIDGQSLAPESITDIQAPEIFVNFPEVTDNVTGYKNELPLGQVGMEYKFFSAEALDLQNGACDYDVNVYYKDGNVERRIFNHTATSFIPDKEGAYVLVYRTKDIAGNSTEKRMMIFVENTISKITYDCQDMPAEGVQGEIIELAQGRASGGSGPITVDRKVLYDGKELAVENGKFVPLRSGEYIIKVTLTDYLGTVKTETFTIDIKANTKPVLVEAVVPVAVFAGKEFTFPTWAAYDYTEIDENDTPKSIPVTIKVDGETLKDGKWTPVLSEGVKQKAFTVQFVAGSGDNESIESRTVYVVSSSRDNRYFTNYFYLENATIPDSYAEIPLMATASDAKAYFINALGDKNFELRFEGDSEKNCFDALRINIFDSVNAAQKLTLEIEKGSDKTSTRSVIKMNGKVIGYISGSFYTKSPFLLRYNYKTGAFTDYEGNTVGYAETAEGEKIVGFESGYVYVSFEFVNASITNDAVVKIKSVCQQAVSATTGLKDRTVPVTTIEALNTFDYGADVVMKPAYAYDVISSIQKFTLTVISPSGRVVLNEVDATVENRFKVTEYGEYNVLYYVKDTNGNFKEIPRVVYCFKYTEPVLEFDGTIPSKVKINSEITIPNIRVSNTDEETRVSVFLLKPNGQKISVEGNKVKVTDLGKHRIIVIACDQYGNTDLASFDFTVEK